MDTGLFSYFSIDDTELASPMQKSLLFIKYVYVLYLLIFQNNEFVAPNISIAKDTADSIPPIHSTSKVTSQRVTMKDLVKESEVSFMIGYHNE